MTTGFKIVREDVEGRLWSSGLYAKDANEYGIHQWTAPHIGCGPLCVFDNLDAANIFLYDIIHGDNLSIVKGYKLFSCRYIPSYSQSVWTAKRVWERDLLALPPGTALARCLILERNITGVY